MQGRIHNNNVYRRDDLFGVMEREKKDINQAVTDWSRDSKYIFFIDEKGKEKSFETALKDAGFKFDSKGEDNKAILEKVWKEIIVSKLFPDSEEENRGKILEHMKEFMTQFGYLWIVQTALLQEQALQTKKENDLTGGALDRQIKIGKEVEQNGKAVNVTGPEDKKILLTVVAGQLHIKEVIRVDRVVEQDMLAEELPETHSEGGKNGMMTATGKYVLAINKKGVPECHVESIILDQHSDITRKMFGELDTRKKELAAKMLESTGNKNNIDAFLTACVEVSSRATVENSSDVLAEKRFSEDDLKVMRECKLGDIESYIDAGSEFKIKFGDRSVSFSNRDASRGELRAGILKDNLNKLRQENQEITLYDALDRLVHAPRQEVQMFVAPLVAHEEDFSKNELNLVEYLINFSLECRLYLEEGKQKGIPNEESTARLKKFIEAEREKIISDGLDGKVSTSTDLLEWIKKTEREDALKWIADVHSLVKGTTNEESRVKIEEVATSAHVLLIWHLSKNLAIDNSKGIELTGKFVAALDAVKDLKIEKISRKNALNVFLFIPSIINFIKTRGEAFWLRSDSKVAVKDHLNLDKAPVNVLDWMKEKPQLKHTGHKHALLKTGDIPKVELTDERKKQFAKSLPPLPDSKPKNDGGPSFS